MTIHPPLLNNAAFNQTHRQTSKLRQTHNRVGANNFPYITYCIRPKLYSLVSYFFAKVETVWETEFPDPLQRLCS